MKRSCQIGPKVVLYAAGANVLLNKPVVACPAGEYGGTTCSAVNDGNDGTRYIAAADGDWWILIDAGALVTVQDYRVVGPTHVSGDLCNEGGAKTIAGYTANPTSLNADPSMVFHVSTVSLPCWDGPSTGVVVTGALPRPFTARYFLILGHSGFYGGWNEFALYESAPLVPPTSNNALLDRPVVSCPAGNYATDFGSGNCGDINDGNDATRYTAAFDGPWSVVIDAGADVSVKDFHVAGPTPIPGGCSGGTAKISGFSGPPFAINSATMAFQYDLPPQCWSGATLDGTLPHAFTATTAPTVCPRRVRAEAEPRPPLRLTVVAPKPAPAVPSANATPAADATPATGAGNPAPSTSV